MKIDTLTIENFKGYFGKHTFKFNNRLVFIVGENNSGKSTIFEAISFILNGIPKGKTIDDLRNKNASADANVQVTLTITGKLSEELSLDSKFNDYVKALGAQEEITLRRQSKSTNWSDSKGKEKTIATKNIAVLNATTEIFENPAGIDKTLTGQFETQFIWADTNPDDVSSFASTKIAGRLLRAASGNFFESTTWKKFEKMHKHIFMDRDNEHSLAHEVGVLQTNISEMLSDQYGKTNVKIKFEFPKPDSFIGQGGFDLDDGVETPVEEKGNGMQRALALVLIQLYARELAKDQGSQESETPILFFIDEPETFLHPRAQNTLMTSLKGLSEHNQVFVATHSPYLLKSFHASEDSLIVVKKDEETSANFDISSELGVLGTLSPSWGEINYFAYDICWPEFHDELYGMIQSKNEKLMSERKLDMYLCNSGEITRKTWEKTQNGTNSMEMLCTLPTYIRNYIHHPENNLNSVFTDVELKQSIEFLLQILKDNVFDAQTINQRISCGMN